MITLIKHFLSILRDSAIDIMTFLFELLSEGFDYIFNIAVDILMA